MNPLNSVKNLKIKIRKLFTFEKVTEIQMLLTSVQHLEHQVG